MRAVANIVAVFAMSTLVISGFIPPLPPGPWSPWWWFYAFRVSRPGPTETIYILGLPVNSPYPGYAELSVAYDFIFRYEYAGIAKFDERRSSGIRVTDYAVDGQSRVSYYLARVQRFDIYYCILTHIYHYCEYENSYVIPVYVEKLPTGYITYEDPGDPVDNTVVVLITVDETGKRIGRYVLDVIFKEADHSFHADDVLGQTITLTRSELRESGIYVSMSVGGNIGPVSISTTLSVTYALGTSQNVEVKYTYRSFRNGLSIRHDVDFYGSWSSNSYPLVWAWRTVLPSGSSGTYNNPQCPYYQL